MITIGEHSIVPVLDSVVRNEPTKMYRSTTPEMWEAHREFLTPDGRIEMFLGGYVVRSSDRLVLIDAGVGPEGWKAPSNAFMPPGFLVDNLRVSGMRPEAFTDVVLTHLHPDHIGWTSFEGRPVFPNATYRCHRDDWRYFLEEDPGDPTARRLLLPLASRFETWEGLSELFPGVTVVPAPGHTPGSSIVVVSASSGERAVLLGDVVHCPIQLEDDEWEAVADVDPALAKKTRTRIARELEGTMTMVGAAHFPELRFGRLLIAESKRQWSSIR